MMSRTVGVARDTEPIAHSSNLRNGCLVLQACISLYSASGNRLDNTARRQRENHGSDVSLGLVRVDGR
jgi:hypothetical protein